jgi:general secretion pathway protein M
MRKALALTLLAALVALLWFAWLQPLHARYFAFEQSIERSRELLDRYARISAGADRLTQLLQQLKARHDVDAGALQGDSIELAGAEMQERLKRIVEEGGGQISSSQVLPLQEQDRQRRLGLRIVMTGNIDAVQKALHGFEAGEPYFFIDKLKIQAPRAIAHGAPGRRPRQPSYEMQVVFEVYGYFRTGV